MKKKSSGFRLQIWFAVSFFPFLLLGVEQGGAEVGKSNPRAKWEETVRKAEKEGKLSIYMSRGGEFHKIVRGFHKEYPKIRVSIVLGGSHYSARILSERRAKKYLADLVVTGPGTPYYVLYRGKILDPIKPILILPEVADTSKWWRGKHHYIDPEDKYVFVFMGPVSAGVVYYNTNRVNPSEFKSYQDLLNPKWKGKLLMEDPRAPGAARLGLRVIY